eukprot:3628048-Prymnesium_polylepis.1
MLTLYIPTTLTLGRDAKTLRPTPHSPRRRDAAITKIARSKLDFATQGRMRVRHIWQQALSAADCTDAHVTRLYNANP